MAPIRVGFIGLSKSGWAPRAHLPYLKDSDKYQIVAICNTSIESSKAAIELYSLPSSTKAYGDPEELAKDKDIDLVVCAVRVDYHFQTIAPSLKAGKDVFVEWPLAKNFAEAKELLKLKNEGGVKSTIVGLQARKSPTLQTIKNLIESGKIGKVLSSTWNAQAGLLGSTITETYEYMGDRKVGGNMVTIHFGHSVDYVQHVLGYGFESAQKSVLANRREIIGIISAEGKTVKENVPKTSEDTIFLIGTLSSGIPLSMTLRGGKAFKDTPALDWRIYGETGEIRITSSTAFLNIGSADLKIQVFDTEKDSVEDVESEKDEFDEDGKFGMPARNVGRVYKAFAEGENTCSFEDAVERHALIDAMYKENGIDV